MKKKIANIVELLFIIATFVMLQIPFITVAEQPDMISPSIEFDTSAWYMMSYYEITFAPMCVLFILCAVMCIISIFTKKEHRDSVIHCIVPIVLFVSVNWCMISSGNAGGLDIVKNKFPTGAFEVCLLAIIIIGFVKRSTLIAGHPNVNVVNQTPTPTQSQADELKKFKELLDSGIITQEEFDAKKKQLLGL